MLDRLAIVTVVGWLAFLSFHTRAAEREMNSKISYMLKWDVDVSEQVEDVDNRLKKIEKEW